jgi:predicted small lipoprotein YifL
MHCWARYLFYAVVAVLAVGQMMAACGQKGDLYLPKTDGGTASKAAAAEAQPVAPPPPADAADAESLDALDDTPTVAPPPISPAAEGL